ncbi:Uma2 family endonuclease [Deinococcus radiopugnans]|uniref:Uma2 family endonuclease n=2 Tax=Deinococcus radiopugnans ATCC 19172 TaxID=585398 RepID=A0A5C4Y839_9DEIO|nr:Uma2 family endonuclease [Deinococcus radiopugnans]TNM71518.1 Uma2 family endonuclease [Deinococcus radiopugnans ATCC 19172]
MHGKDTPNAQAGALSRHGLIGTNLIAALHRPALRQGCKVYASDMRVRIQARGTRYDYPDVVLTCEDMADDARDASSPCFIVEVLSQSTQVVDRGQKLSEYTALPSLQGYLMVDTATRAARLYTRQGEGWGEQYVEEAGVLRLPCVDVELTLDDVYEGTSLQPPHTPQPASDPTAPKHGLRPWIASAFVPHIRYFQIGR